MASFIADRPEGCIDRSLNALRVIDVGNPGNVNFADAEVPSGTIDGVNDTYTLAHTPSPSASLQLFLNGLCQTEGIDYTLSGATITYANPPSTGDTLICWYRY